MIKSLMVVESPTKAKVIAKYLNKDFKVMASYGHIRDLIATEGAVDPSNNFKMNYQILKRNHHHITAIVKVLQHCENLFLATDPDREGEAIAWHIKQVLDVDNLLKNKYFFRVTFHQITKKAIENAIKNPRGISMDLVNAQQARRALDYLVGFNLSPLLWLKIGPGLSAGRVQSPALRMIVDREVEIENFKSQQYWTVYINCQFQKHNFNARLTEFKNTKIGKFSITTKKKAHDICNAIKKSTDKNLTIATILKQKYTRHPFSPFITSTMQRAAAQKLGFSVSKTMQIAQQLYEGIEIRKQGTTGLITYMRTDSVELSLEAIEEIRELIRKRYGKENVSKEARIYKNKSKNTQEAHEAIRPTSIFRFPENLKEYLTRDQLQLYTLIWKRAVSCQMIDAILCKITINLKAPSNSFFRYSSAIIINPGFTIVCQTIDDKRSDDRKNKVLSYLQKGQIMAFNDITGKQSFTESLPRYTEASLIKDLVKYDIGRPSTYENIISTLKNRKYIEIDDRKRFVVTDTGRTVNRFLTNYFAKYVDYKFTAELENELDNISRGEKVWLSVLEAFWFPFQDLVKVTKKIVKRSDVVQEKIDKKCPECNNQLSVRLGKRGSFIGCTAYPNCNYTANIINLTINSLKEDIEKRRPCPRCQSDLVIKKGRYGKFIGCYNYPNCCYIEPLKKPKDTQIICPKCNKGTIVKRRSHQRKIFFYSCVRYPNCDYTIRNIPIAQKCPMCHWPILLIKRKTIQVTEKFCPQKNCNFSKYFNDK
ncbi:type I DNA topoisomerase [Coxiella-like endosymbiont of Amblyomma americanum]|uniref:type I DNA topoisomerase n=1 Tax=Coxiella-like endosymbiont of Amblyomma americanum TaxID=1987500 RepID=UPI000F89E4FF|nr:type I DNA topoisomerase [Coxiella-like endosymbiont of Amblyomma americanum]AUJ58704.1 DNA topoisomerase I [Coxiella-like endosymbiont of Amblyomma americanum]